MRTQSRWKCSRPLLFGGGSANHGSCAQAFEQALRRRGRWRRMRRARRTACRGGVRTTHPSMRSPGRCRSRARRPAPAASVKFAMPPRLSTARASFASCSSAAWKAGTSGAPWPPAARSRRRKSATVSMPRAFGDDVAVADLPGEGMRDRGPVADRSVRASRSRARRPARGRADSSKCSAASAKASATCTSSVPSLVERSRVAALAERDQARAQRRHPSDRCGRRTSVQCVPSKRTSAASMPSALVPEIRPR